jgi:DNA-directed RNA polymerase specialized sigma24 family protein
LIRAVKLEGLSVQEAAVRFSRSIAWVKVNTHRAIKSLGELARK